MITVNNAATLREQSTQLRRGGKRVAFVPTMGNLHAGHLRLMQEARQYAQIVIASIYVNPLQFGANEDFSAYPRTPGHDKISLLSAGVDLLFMPDDKQIYPRGVTAQTRVEVPDLSDDLCGVFRPGHFRGVTTVVNRLFNLVAPDVAMLGKKDYQQLLLIRLMVTDLGMPIEIIGVDTVRETDGLAMSSRNKYLTPEERKSAPQLYAILISLRDRLMAQYESIQAAEEKSLNELKSAGFRTDYVSVRRQEDLGAPQSGDRQLVVLAAAWLGHTRLIDNVEFVLK